MSTTTKVINPNKRSRSKAELTKSDSRGPIPKTMASLPNPSLPLAADSESSTSSDDGETFSLDETMKDYPVHFNRTYHKYKEGSYPFPNDLEEQYRMDVQFCLIKIAQGGRLFFSPVQSPRAILDVGTGTGIWAISVADHIFPDAEITGIDLSPIQPSEVPRNVKFELQDCSDSDWVRALGSLDFVYAQSLFGSLQDYAKLMITARKYLSPRDGWIECCELDPMPQTDDKTIPENWGLTNWTEWMVYGAEKAGRPFRVAHKLKQWMIDAGYVDVQEVIVKMPIGSWPADPKLKKIGKQLQALICETLAAASYRTFNEILDWPRETIEVFLADVRSSTEIRKVHSYYRCHTVYGRRPSPNEEIDMKRMAPPPRPKPNN